MAYATFEDGTADPSRSLDGVGNARRLRSAPGHLSPVRFEDRHARRMVKAYQSA